MHINLFLTRYTVAILTLTFQYYITHLTIPSTHASTLYLPPSDIQHTFNTLLSLHSSDSYFKTFLIHSPDPPTSNTPTFFHYTKPSTHITLFQQLSMNYYKTLQPNIKR